MNAARTVFGKEDRVKDYARRRIQSATDAKRRHLARRKPIRGCHTHKSRLRRFACDTSLRTSSFAFNSRPQAARSAQQTAPKRKDTQKRVFPFWHSEQPLRKHKYFLADGTTMDCIISRSGGPPTARYSRCSSADMHPFRNAAGTLKKRPQDFSRGHFVIPSSMTAAQLFGPAPLRCCHP